MFTRIASRIRFPKKRPQQTIFLVGHNNIFPYTHTLTHTYLCTVDVECAYRRSGGGAIRGELREAEGEGEREGWPLGFYMDLFLGARSEYLSGAKRPPPLPPSRPLLVHSAVSVCEVQCLYACMCMCACLCVCTVRTRFHTRWELAIQFTRAARSSGRRFYTHCRIQVVV